MGTIAFVCEVTRSDFALDLLGSRCGCECGTLCPSSPLGKTGRLGRCPAYLGVTVLLVPAPSCDSQFVSQAPRGYRSNLLDCPELRGCFFFFFPLFPEEPEMRPNKVPLLRSVPISALLSSPACPPFAGEPWVPPASSSAPSSGRLGVSVSLCLWD